MDQLRRTGLALAAACLLVVLPLASPAAAQRIENPELFAKSLDFAYHALEQYGPLEIREEVERLNDIGYRVARESGFTKFPFTFHLIDMPAPNAFALPGGHIFVTRGMLELGLSDDMLAALLGHEIAHVTEEHYLQMKRKATLLNILSQALVVGVMLSDGDSGSRRPGDFVDPRQRERGGGNLVEGAMAAGLLVTELLLRGYSRNNESEADQEGQRWAAAAGFSPDGAAELMALMRARIPQDKEYGYWMTHPFFDERVRGARGMARLLARGDPESADAFRARTQAAILDYAETAEPRPEVVPLLEEQALRAWPQGPTAERLRLARLHAERDAELERPTLSRDYGALVRSYEEQRYEVERRTPESPFLATLDRETEALVKERDDIYPKAVELLAEGIYETDFLRSFLSNYPASPQAPAAALSLGDAYSRLGDTTEGVSMYLRAVETAPESEAGKRALAGLERLAPRVDRLAALQQLASQPFDAGLARVARERLAELAGDFDEIENGAEYLERFPGGAQTEAVRERVHRLAEDLYGELVLYRAAGDHVRAVERIHKILSYAPASPAAERLRDQVVLEG